MRQRPAIIKIEETSVGNDASCTVILSYADAEFRGSSIGSGEPNGRPRIIGEATLRAVEAVIDGAIGLSLEAVALSDVGDVMVALAQVGVAGSSEMLVGSAMVKENDPSKATVKAVLDALNRRIDAHLG